MVAYTVNVYELGSYSIRIACRYRIGRLPLEHGRDTWKGLSVNRAEPRIFGFLLLGAKQCLSHASSEAGTSG